MFKAIGGLLSSKKFWLTILGTVVIAIVTPIMSMLGVSEDVTAQVLTYIAGLFGVSLAGIGMADFGKAAKK